jgi:hypothetical protein
MNDPPNDKASHAEQRQMLDSLLAIGQSRPLICFPISAIIDANSAPEIVAASALALGLAAVKFPNETCCVQGGALYVYDRAALKAFLQVRAVAVGAAGLPLQPDAFVVQIATIRFPAEHLARPIIAAVLGKVVE